MDTRQASTRRWPGHADSSATRTTSWSWSPAPATTPKRSGTRWQRCSLRWACACRKRRRGSATSTRGSTSRAGASSAETWRGRERQAGGLHLSVEEGAGLGDGQGAALTRRAKHRTLADLLRRLNPVLRGWCNYFRHGVSSRTFSYLDHFAWWRIVGWLRKRHLGLNWGTLRPPLPAQLGDQRRRDRDVPATRGGDRSIPLPGHSDPHTMGERANRITRTSGMNTWRAGCGESRTSGSEGGPGKPTSRKAGRALRSDPYTKLHGPETWRVLRPLRDHRHLQPLRGRLDAWPRPRPASWPRRSSRTPWPPRCRTRPARPSTPIGARR